MMLMLVVSDGDGHSNDDDGFSGAVYDSVNAKEIGINHKIWL